MSGRAPRTDTADEMMTVAAARALRDGQVLLRRDRPAQSRRPTSPAACTPRTWCSIYESGHDRRQARRSCRSRSATACWPRPRDAVVSVPEIFNYWLQPGRIDVGFLGAAQIDRYGNINTTVIGDYDEPEGAAARRRRRARDRRVAAAR